MFQMLSLLLLPASLPAWCCVCHLPLCWWPVSFVAQCLEHFAQRTIADQTTLAPNIIEWNGERNEIQEEKREREKKNTRRIDSKWAVTFSIIFNCTIKVSKTCFLLLFVLKSGICCGFADGFFPLHRVTSRSRHRLCGFGLAEWTSSFRH